MFKKRKENQAKLKEQRLEKVQKIIQELKKGNTKRPDTLEKFKDVQRVAFDYFKHLSTLSTGSTLILIAFFEKVFSCPKFKGWALFSVICFVSCLVLSLWALQSANNLVLLPVGIKTIYASGIADEEDVNNKADDVQKGWDKITKAFGLLGRYDKITMGLFSAGIVSLLIFAIINFLD